MPKTAKISESLRMKGLSELEGGRHAPSNPENVVNSSTPPLKQQYDLGGRMASSEEGGQGERERASIS